MSRSTLVGVFGLAVALAVGAGCSSTKKPAVYEHEQFDDSGTYSRTFPVNDAGACEAARRALLSQGYIITSTSANQIAGNKSFQQNAENHLQISFNLTCVPDSNDAQRSVLFANALQDRYALKKSNTSASLGVGVLGSVSMPIGSSDDSMVKVASETVTAPQFYERYFALVQSYLPKAHPVTRTEPVSAPTAPAAPALGLPEQALAPAATSNPATSLPVSVPTSTAPVAPSSVTGEPLDDSQGSQPLAPPADPAPLEVQAVEPPQTPAPNAAPATQELPPSTGVKSTAADSTAAESTAAESTAADSPVTNAE